MTDKQPAPPTAEDQLQFLNNIQRLLDEGQFTSTYKFALLMALADLAVEQGDDTGGTLILALDGIAEKFVQYYWQHTLPFTPPGQSHNPVCLKQNSNGQVEIISRLIRIQTNGATSLTAARHNSRIWNTLIRQVSTKIRKMPLNKLQTVGNDQLIFLYQPSPSENSVTLLPGVAYCLRRFHELIISLIEGAWLRQIRRFRANQIALGSTKDLSEFLFGSERSSLDAYRPILRDIQNGRCFYCDGRLKDIGEVDHFIPWSRYPIDLGHNFVLAHKSCNNSKRDMLAGISHLEHWIERNSTAHDDLNEAFLAREIYANLQSSNRITWWAYSQTEHASGNTWISGNDIAQLDPTWRELLEPQMAI